MNLFPIVLVYVGFTELIYALVMWGLLESRRRVAAAFTGIVILMGAVTLGYTALLCL